VLGPLYELKGTNPVRITLKVKSDLLNTQKAQSEIQSEEFEELITPTRSDKTIFYVIRSEAGYFSVSSLESNLKE